MVNNNIPFYGNTADNTHCLQASLKMILEHFKPDQILSFEDMDIISAKVEDLWTWQFASTVWMQEQGFEVVDIEVFDFPKFIEKGEDYILEFFGQEAGQVQIKNSKISQEIDYAKKFYEVIRIEKRIPDLDDIKKFLDQGYLLICGIDSGVLDGGEYAAHAVAVKGYDENSLYVNDPGLPPIENRKVSFELFQKAWSAPSETARNILAFKLK